MSRLSLLLFSVVGAALAGAPQGTSSASDAGPEALAGTWLYAGDVTPDRTLAERAPNYGSTFTIRLEESEILVERPGSARASMRLPRDGSERTSSEGDEKTTESGRWRDGALHVVVRSDSPGQGQRRVSDWSYVFTPEADGLRLALKVTGSLEMERTCIYRQKDQIEPRAPVAAKATALEWLAGDWNGEKGKRSREERWSGAAGGALLGTSRTLSGGRMVAFEFLRIVEKGGQLLYVAQPNGAPSTEFTLVELDESRAVFENPFHDFPQRITYERADDQLLAEISFIDGGSPQRFDFKRVR